MMQIKVPGSSRRLSLLLTSPFVGFHAYPPRQQSKRATKEESRELASTTRTLSLAFSLRLPYRTRLDSSSLYTLFFLCPERRPITSWSKTTCNPTDARDSQSETKAAERKENKPSSWPSRRLLCQEQTTSSTRFGRSARADDAGHTVWQKRTSRRRFSGKSKRGSHAFGINLSIS